MNLALTPSEFEALRKAVQPFCARTDVADAMKRVPGGITQDQWWVDQATVNDLVDKCVKATAGLDRRNTFRDSFLLRLVEQKWDQEKARREIVGAAKSLVRPSRGFETQIADFAAAIGALLQRIDAAPAPGRLGDERLFRGLCNARPAVERLADELDSIADLKAAHDALHMLQVHGAEWLSALHERHDESLAPTFVLLLQGASAAASVDPTKLPAAVQESLARVVAFCRDAERRVAANAADDRAFACSQVHALLLREPSIIDRAMFEMSRDLPLSELCEALQPDQDPVNDVASKARNAAIDFADTLRRRLMEHALWQAIDLQLYALEQLLAQPPATLLAGVMDICPYLLRDVGVLVDSDEARGVVRRLRDAVDAYDRATDPRGATGDSAVAIELMRSAFVALRQLARSEFLHVNQTLRGDLAQLSGLKAPLQAILTRIPRTCQMMVEP